MRIVVYYILLLSLLTPGCKKETDTYKTPTPESYNHNREPGKSAADYLSGQPYKSLRIELDYMPGYRPDTRSINIFTELLSERLNKPGGIFIVEKEIDPTLKTVFTLNDINTTESENRATFTFGEQMSACILITNGSYYNGSIIGMAYKNTSICFFGEPLSNFSTGTTEDEKIRAIALLFLHEFGHLLGLVDMGTPMIIAHRDPVNGNHCDNNACIMHHSFEPIDRNIARFFSGNYNFDANCIIDLRLNGGK